MTRKDGQEVLEESELGLYLCKAEDDQVGVKKKKP